VLKGDLADVVDVTRFAKAFIETFSGRLDYLILNAGLAGFHKRRSAQGLDLVMGIIFLGHFPGKPCSLL
jgi:NAD(P)-dependent dehydrogenase (short-subunit alcohol dehydrogenase family)